MNELDPVCSPNNHTGSADMSLSESAPPERKRGFGFIDSYSLFFTDDEEKAN